ncbi:8950_t:CDS:2 [Cetraspora pellucida]|uniref:8950_t:CDS:1 n=1 Tax=Cetraspora pellucida TaxID=1433469 RepID=A0ACA9KD00_9GLOM|nr:8950_t:CDS:2 [Cetraspora pellucida]
MKRPNSKTDNDATTQDNLRRVSVLICHRFLVESLDSFDVVFGGFFQVSLREVLSWALREFFGCFFLSSSGVLSQALEYSVGESTIHDILKEKSRWLASETIKSRRVPTTNISTNSSTISNVSTNSTRESSTINYENTTTTVFHNSIIATNNEGATTLHKSSTTNIDNMTTMIQNNIITINQHGIITSVQDKYLNQDKDISIEEILDYDIIEKISLNNISKEKISIQDEDDTSTIHDDDEFFSNSNNSIQDILNTFNKLLFFLKYLPNNLEISKLEIESVKSLYEKTKALQFE